MSLLGLQLLLAAAGVSGAYLPSLRPLQQRHVVNRQRAGNVAMVTRGVVITGGAGGVGYAYADEFVRRGHYVVICDVKDPTAAVTAIREKHAGTGTVGAIHGTVCDVSDSESVEALAEFAKEKIGVVHYWINNAGINGGRRPFSDVPTKVVETVVKVNLVGVLLCTQVRAGPAGAGERPATRARAEEPTERPSPAVAAAAYRASHNEKRLNEKVGRCSTPPDFDFWPTARALSPRMPPPRATATSPVGTHPPVCPPASSLARLRSRRWRSS